MFEKENKVSILIAAYNAEKTIEQCVRSAMAQTHKNIEIIVVDDVSTDSTLKIAQDLQKFDARIVVHQREHNGGPGAARNSALELSTGYWVTVLDSDDWYFPNRIEFLFGLANKNKSDLVFDNLLCIKDNKIDSKKNSEPFISSESSVLGELTLEMYVKSFSRSKTLPNLGYLKPFIKRSILASNNIRYNTRLNVGEDSLLVMELFAAGAKNVIFADELLYCYRRHDSSISKNMSAHDLEMQVREYGSFLRSRQHVLSREVADRLRRQIEYYVESSRKRRSWNSLLDNGLRVFILETIEKKEMRKYFFRSLFKYLKLISKSKNKAV
ncbi:glycosyl transferase [Spongiibacter sp. IMCC21906]|nr:glycosyl transferase [Spongiibacter sp. IMCC21906]